MIDVFTQYITTSASQGAPPPSPAAAAAAAAAQYGQFQSAQQAAAVAARAGRVGDPRRGARGRLGLEAPVDAGRGEHALDGIDCAHLVGGRDTDSDQASASPDPN